MLCRPVIEIILFGLFIVPLVDLDRCFGSNLFCGAVEVFLPGWVVVEDDDDFLIGLC